MTCLLAANIVPWIAERTVASLSIGRYNLFELVYTHYYITVMYEYGLCLTCQRNACNLTLEVDTRRIREKSVRKCPNTMIYLATPRLVKV